MTKNCYIMVGVSGSGKSTAVKKLIDHHAGQNIAVFSLDSARLDFYDQINSDPKQAYADAYKYATENAERFDEFVRCAWTETLKADVIVVDNTNLTKKSRARWVNEARAKGFKIIAIQMMTPLETVLARQMTRSDKQVPAETVRDMYFRQQEVLVGSEADVLLVVDGREGSTFSLQGQVAITG